MGKSVGLNMVCYSDATYAHIEGSFIIFVTERTEWLLYG